MLEFGKALPAILRCRRFDVAADDNRVVFLAAARLTGLNVPAAYADDFSVSGANQPMTATGWRPGIHSKRGSFLTSLPTRIGGLRSLAPAVLPMSTSFRGADGAVPRVSDRSGCPPAKIFRRQLI